MPDIDPLIEGLRSLIPPSPSVDALTRDGMAFLDRILSEHNLVLGGEAQPGHFHGRLIYEDPDHGFILVAMTWGEGAQTPIHDHGTWGLMGVTQGMLEFSNFVPVGPSRQVREVGRFTAQAGDVTRVLPPDMEIHQISNPGPGLARSLHIYGENIGF